jgi:uncharacterized protein YjbJ (UPF0337 family)
MNGKNQQIRGKFRELTGKMTWNVGRMMSGKYDQGVGKVREKWQKAKASI